MVAGRRAERWRGQGGPERRPAQEASTGPAARGGASAAAVGLHVVAGWSGGARGPVAAPERSEEELPVAEKPGCREEEGGPRLAAWRDTTSPVCAPDTESTEPNGRIADDIENAAAGFFALKSYCIRCTVWFTEPSAGSRL